jgi:hypothetical protein
MAGETLVYFGHHKCATQYIKAVVRHVADWLGLTFETVDYPVGAPEPGADGTPRHHLHIKHKGYVAPTADILYFANANAAAIAALTARGGYRGFHVIRDPRDIVVSGYFSHLYSHPITEQNREPMGVWRQQLAAAPSQEEGLLLELEFEAAYFENLRGWDYTNPQSLELRYEGLIRDPRATFTQAFAFWGLSMPRRGLPTLALMAVQRGWRRVNRQPMPPRRCLPQPLLTRILSRNAFDRKTGGRVPGAEDPRHHYRKGVAGDWRNYFTPRVTAAFKDRYGDLLVTLGYETSLDW